MTVTELFEKIDAHPDLEGVGLLTTEKGPAMLVRHKTTSMMSQFPVELVETLDWALLESILTCKREPSVLNHMSRVVGYFSRIENWNASKIGELKDRHKGNYQVAMAYEA